jgi:hypothetical protein
MGHHLFAIVRQPVWVGVRQFAADSRRTVWPGPHTGSWCDDLPQTEIFHNFVILPRFVGWEMVPILTRAWKPVGVPAAALGEWSAGARSNAAAIALAALALPLWDRGQTPGLMVYLLRLTTWFPARLGRSAERDRRLWFVCAGKRRRQRSVMSGVDHENCDDQQVEENAVSAAPLRRFRASIRSQTGPAQGR